MKLSHLKAGDPAALIGWARKLIDDLNRDSDPLAALPGPYADDAAAEAAGVAVGFGYIDDAGIARRRMG